MATGRRDYTIGFLNESTSEGRYGTTLIETSFRGIQPDGGEDVHTYVVPAGYQLLVNRVVITTSSRVTCGVFIRVNSDDVGNVYFSDNYTFLFSEDAPLLLDAGDTIIIAALNYDDTPCVFWATLMGVLQQLT